MCVYACLHDQQWTQEGSVSSMVEHLIWCDASSDQSHHAYPWCDVSMDQSHHADPWCDVHHRIIPTIWIHCAVRHRINPTMRTHGMVSVRLLAWLGNELRGERELSSWASHMVRCIIVSIPPCVIGSIPPWCDVSSDHSHNMDSWCSALSDQSHHANPISCLASTTQLV